MGKEDIGFIISSISIFKTIDSNYFISPSNGYTLESLLSLGDFQDNGIYTSGKQFFQDIFDMFICTDNNLLNLDTLRKKIYLVENLNISINSLFINSIRTDIFTVDDIQNFYRHSSALLFNLKYLIQHIELKNEHFNNNEFSAMNLIQNNYKSYILNTFWGKYFLSLSETSIYSELHTIEQIHNLITPQIQTINTTSTINNSTLQRYLIQLTVSYDKKKTKFFDQINYNSKFFNDMKNMQTPKQVYLYLYKDLISLTENHFPNYTHNLLGSETSSYRQYFVNMPNDQKYHVKYHINGMKEAYNIFIHSFYMNNNKKVFVGFAFKDIEHYRKSISHFLYDTQIFSLSLYGTFNQGKTLEAILNHYTHIDSIHYKWEKQQSNTNIFDTIENADGKSFTIPYDSDFTEYYIRCKTELHLINGKSYELYSKPYLINF